MARRVLIVQKTLPQYRRRFFELLRDYLALEGIELGLIYGQPEPAEASRQDVVHLEWATERRTRFLALGRRRLYWQPCLGDALRADLVIVEQASKLMVNYPLLALQVAGVTRLAFWGHGRTPKATAPSRVGEAAKAFMSRRVHWWFAYNELSASHVRDLGFDPQRITAIQNAIDTRALAAAAAAVTERELDGLRAGLGLEGTNVCIYVGAMYREKRLPFVIAACELIRKRVPDFEMLFLGAGPDRPMIQEAVARNSWMHYLGPLFDDVRVPYFRLAKLALMPGGVGLGVLDSFTLEVPMLTTAVPYHGPEIEYLHDGVNGVIVNDSDSPGAYADAVATLLADEPALERLKTGCRESAARYTVEAMASRFAAGVVAALKAESRQRSGARASS